MASYSKALTKTLHHEGGYAFVEGDEGRETYKGVARKSHPMWKGWEYIDAEKNVRNAKKLKHNEKLNNRNLDREVENIYRKNYWNKIKGDLIKDDDLASLMFDIVVNHGRGVWLIQKAVNNLGYLKDNGKPLVLDNKFGSNTIRAVNSVNPNSLYNQLLIERKLYYDQLINNKPKLEKFRKGWNKRVNSFIRKADFQKEESMPQNDLKYKTKINLDEKSTNPLIG